MAVKVVLLQVVLVDIKKLNPASAWQDDGGTTEDLKGMHLGTSARERARAVISRNGEWRCHGL